MIFTRYKVWIGYCCQEERAKGIALALLVLSVFFAPVLSGWANWLAALSYFLLLAGMGLAHMFNFMSDYKGWYNPTRMFCASGVYAAVAVMLLGASPVFAACMLAAAWIHEQFIDQDRAADALIFAPEIAQAREKDRLAREEKQGRNKKTEPGSV